MGLFNKIFGSYNDRELKKIYPIADAIEKLEPEYAALTDDALRAKTEEFKARYNDGETLDELLPRLEAASGAGGLDNRDKDRLRLRTQGDGERPHRRGRAHHNEGRSGVPRRQRQLCRHVP